MVQNLPIYISLIFGLTMVVTLVLFIWAISNADSEKTRNFHPAIIAREKPVER